MAGIDQRLEKTRTSINKKPHSSVSNGVLSNSVTDIVLLFQFENSTEAGVGAHCNKMIMLLTDGSTDNGDEVFKRRNFNRPLKVSAWSIRRVTIVSVKGINTKWKNPCGWFIMFTQLILPFLHLSNVMSFELGFTRSNISARIMSSVKCWYDKAFVFCF